MNIAITTFATIEEDLDYFTLYSPWGEIQCGDAS
jgi:hypothetical protein